MSGHGGHHGGMPPGSGRPSRGGGGGGGIPPQYFSLRWNNHPANLVSVFSGLFSAEQLTDVTLAAEGQHIQAHKVLLSACSDYFQSVFAVNPCKHPIVILKDVKFDDLHTVVQFMYNGVVNVSSDKLPDVLKTADTLQIKGLGEKFSESVNQIMGGGSGSGGGAGSSMSSSRGAAPTPRLLSVPSQHSVNSRQYSTESLPEYFHRTRSFSPRQASTDSRQMSIESSVSAMVRKQPTPPASPPRHLRKKFRRMSGCGSSSERGNSLEEDRSPVHPPSTRAATPPTIHLSPSRQSSSGSNEADAASVGNHAKKKRELFSARSSRSGGSNKSSKSDYSRDHSFRQLESSGSSGQSHSINQSQEDSSALGTASTATSLTVPSSGRTLARAQSAEAATSSSSSHPPAKRSRFLLKRQDCTEKGIDLTTDGSHESGGNSELAVPMLATTRSSPNSPLMGTSYPSLSSPPHMDNKGERDKDLIVPQPLPPANSPPAANLTKQKSAEKSPYASTFGGADTPPAIHHSLPPQISHKLPSVRVIPDASSDAMEAAAAHHRMAVPNVKLLCPPDFNDHRRIPLVKTRSTESPFDPPSRSSPLLSPGNPGPSRSVFHGDMSLVPASSATSSPSLGPPVFEHLPLPSPYEGMGHHMPPHLQNPHHHPAMGDPLAISPGHPPSHPPPHPLPPQLPLTASSSAASTSSSVTASVAPVNASAADNTFGHCPKARDGPALGCNYCWNTTDTNGRILRRKTKYHCPECQANLCIVPCFQHYHEALEREKGGLSPHSQ